MARPSNSNHVNKAHQASKKDNENEHSYKVNQEQPSDAAKGSDEAGDGNEKDDHTENDERPLEDLDAGVLLFGGEPDSGADDGD